MLRRKNYGARVALCAVQPQSLLYHGTLALWLSLHPLRTVSAAGGRRSPLVGEGGGHGAPEKREESFVRGPNELVHADTNMRNQTSEDGWQNLQMSKSQCGEHVGFRISTAPGTRAGALPLVAEGRDETLTPRTAEDAEAQVRW